MSDTTILMKSLLVIGLLSLLVSTLAASPPPGAPALPADNGYSNLQTQLQQGPPTFNNPFAPQTFTALPVADNTTTETRPNSVTNNDPSTVTDCTTSASPTSNWWGCLTTQDASGSYATSIDKSPTFGQLGVELSQVFGFGQAMSISRLEIALQCREQGQTRVRVMVEFQFYYSNGTAIAFIDQLYCYPGVFQNFTLPDSFDRPYPVVSTFSGASLTLKMQETSPADNATVDFSYVAVTYTIQESPCASSDTLTYIGCILGKALTFAINGFMFVVNGAVFLGQMAVWVLTLVFDFMAGMVTSFVWVLTIPGTPPVVQGLLAAAMIALMGAIVFIIVSRVRGVGNLG